MVNRFFPEVLIENSLESIHVHGEHFYQSAKLKCRFDGTNLDSKWGLFVRAEFVSISEIICLQPRLPVGVFDVYVSNDGNTFDTYPFGHLKVIPSMFVTALEPSFGPCTGGTNITFFGSGFSELNDLVCNFGGITVQATYHSSSEMSCLTPQSASSKLHSIRVNISINGSNTMSKDNLKYSYIPTPIIYNVIPRSISPNGGSLVFVSGEYFKLIPFASQAKCIFGEITVDAKLINETTISCFSPNFQSKVESKVNIIVSIDGGQTFSNEYVLVVESLPKLLSISPLEGVENGGNIVRGK